MRTRKTPGRLLLAGLAVALAFGCAESTGGSGDDVPFPSELDDGLTAFEAEKKIVLDRMRARRPDIRELLSGEVLGETDEGFLALPEPSELVADAVELEMMSDDNDDRAALFELVIRGSVLRSLQEQVESITEQVVDQVCPQLDSKGRACDLLDLENRVREALDKAVRGEEIAADDFVGAIVKSIIDPVVESTVAVVTEAELDNVQAAFGREYQRRAPAGTWIEVDGAWERTSSGD